MSPDTMWTSASKMEVFEICPRKWWLAHHIKLPRLFAMKFSFGTVLHSAIERFYRDEERWPDGWDIDKETGVRVDPADAQLIQVMVTKGIDSGILEKRRGSEIETKIKFPIDDHTMVTGYIDHTDRATFVEDHKHSKKVAYFKSPAKIKSNIQMMLYAKWLLDELRKTGKVPPKVITLAHNQFLKDHESPMVRRREAEVTPAEVERFFAEVIQKICSDMRKIAATATKPSDIPDPMPSACRAYGGCDFIPICTGQETMKQYKDRVDAINARISNHTPEQESKTMTPEEFLAKKAAKAAGNAAPTEAAINPPESTDLPKQEVTAAPPASGYVTPPWTFPTCGLCAKTPTPGFNARKGSPCRICLSQTKVDPAQFEWSVQDGNLLWWKKGEPTPAASISAPVVEQQKTRTRFSIDDFLKAVKAATTGEEVMSVLSEAGEILDEDDMEVLSGVVEKKLEKLATAPVEEPKLDPTPTTVETIPEPVAEAPAEVKKPRTRAKKETPAAEGLVLLVGCALIGDWPGKQIRTAESILGEIDGYWAEEKVFDRRAAVRQAANSMKLSDCVVVQCVRDPDVDNLISSLIPHASIVIRGTIQ